MSTTVTDTAAAVHAILRARGASSQPLAADARLDAEGLGLDSIAIAEVLLDCERRFGTRLVDLLDGEPVTVGRLIARLEQHTAS